MDSVIKKNGKNGRSKLISAPEVVKKFNVSYQTLNYYTNMGLVDLAGRNGRKRLYVEEDLKERLEKIKDLQDKGYTLKLISDTIKSA